MSYIREPNHEDFLQWAKKNPKEYGEFFYDEVLDRILKAETEDYFGTEGFDKRFGG